jgi:rare lipoprotein A (peptidoglycan hydrolase)
MLAKLFLQYVLATVFQVGVDDGYATRFGDPGDPHAGRDMACTQTPIPQDEPVCAHRWLPCGTEVVVMNLERSAMTRCRVTDRGPYGVDPSGRWRGVIDLTPRAATAVRLDGRDGVRLIYQLPRPGPPRFTTTWTYLKAKVPRRSAPPCNDCSARASSTSWGSSIETSE